MPTPITQGGPTVGSLGMSYEWGININTGTKQSPVWTNIPDVTGIDPGRSAVTAKATTYANKGAEANTKVGTNFNPKLGVKPVFDAQGLAQAAVEKLWSCADKVGTEAIVEIQLFSFRAKSLAWQGSASVEYSRQNTGDADIEFSSFELSGQGDFARITNPAFATS